MPLTHLVALMMMRTMNEPISNILAFNIVSFYGNQKTSYRCSFCVSRDFVELGILIAILVHCLMLRSFFFRANLPMCSLLLYFLVFISSSIDNCGILVAVHLLFTLC
jgi:hypothetical protein